MTQLPHFAFPFERSIPPRSDFGEPRNLMPNPSAETALAPWTIAGSSGFVSRSLTREQGWAKSGAWSLRAQMTQPNDTTIRSQYISFGTGLAGVPVRPATRYTLSRWMKVVVGGITRTTDAMQVRFYKTDGSASTEDPVLVTDSLDNGRVAGLVVNAPVMAASPPAGSELRHWVTFETPSDAAFLNVRVYFFNTGDANQVTDAYIDAVSLVEGEDLEFYFDGDSPGYEWTGTAHASASRRIPTDVGSHVRVVEQQSPQHITNQEFAVVVTPMGFREERPDFGWEWPEFASIPLDLSGLRDAFERLIPDSDARVEEWADVADAAIRHVDVSQILSGEGVSYSSESTSGYGGSASTPTREEA